MMVDEATPSDTSSLDRGVMSRLLGKLDLSDSDRQRLAQVDAYVDEALSAVDEEEPSLLAWLQDDPELQEMCWANQSVMYWMILRDMKKGLPLDVTTESLNKLINRMLAATAWRAVMRNRANS